MLWTLLTLPMEGEGKAMLDNFKTELGNLMLWGGGIWMGISVVVVGFCIKDENGAGIRNGLLSALGAALVLVGAGIIKSVGS